MPLFASQEYPEGAGIVLHFLSGLHQEFAVLAAIIFPVIGKAQLVTAPGKSGISQRQPFFLGKLLVNPLHPPIALTIEFSQSRLIDYDPGGPWTIGRDLSLIPNEETDSFRVQFQKTSDLFLGHSLLPE